MKKKLLLLVHSLLLAFTSYAQTNPAITSWIFNDGETGSHYVSGNPAPILDTYLANVESVYYNINYAFISAAGIPAYIIGPYLDGNPAQGTDNDHVFRISLNPVEQAGTKTSTNAGIIGALINGVPVYDWRDAQSYNNQGVWNRDAVVNELDGFDCPKGHPSPIFSGGGGGPGGGGTLVGGVYHHHQNPSAFNLDLMVISDICDTYPSDGLYVINASSHSPLLGFALDGFPIYGAYGYDNTDGTGGIVRIESGYDLRNITVRTHYADGTAVTPGPDVDATYPLGTYKEDYEYTGNGHLDEYNGRFAVTPEYPSGIYAYYTTVDADHNSEFPYSIGPDEYYGAVTGGATSTIPGNAILYNPPLPVELLSFRAIIKEDFVLLDWLTATEINNDFFTLERSPDGVNFREIASVKGKGNSSTVTSYSHKDYDYLLGISYYRLNRL